MEALRNLAEKRDGVLTAFLNIADAQALTELGLACRSRQGWDLTEAGSAYLAELDAPAKGAVTNAPPEDC